MNGMKSPGWIRNNWQNLVLTKDMGRAVDRRPPHMVDEN